MFQHPAREETFIPRPKAQDNRLVLPGFGLPLDYAPIAKNIYGIETRSLFPTSVDDRDIQKGYTDQPIQTLRELGMLKVIEEITDIPDWYRKVFLPGVANEWKRKAMERRDVEITANMAQWIVDELQFKAAIYERTQALAIYNGDVTKSDINVPESFRDKLSEAIAPLEKIPMELRLFTPGMGFLEAGLLPLALYPLIYGRSYILPDRLIGVEDAIANAGQGEVIPIPAETGITREDIAWRVTSRDDITIRPYSRKFQYLPCDFKLENGRWRIDSYINNLHPKRNRDLYNLIEEFFNLTVSQWNTTLTPLKDMLHSRARIEYRSAEYHPLPKALEEQVPKPMPGESQNIFDERLEEWRMNNLTAVQPDADRFTPWAIPRWMMGDLPEDLPTPVRIEEGVDLNKEYGERGLQMIVKVISTRVLPEQTSHVTAWHGESQMNEHVCAAAFYQCYTDNVEAIVMEFRHIAETDSLSEVAHEPNDSVWLKQVYGLEVGDPAVQVAGTMSMKPGRVLMYPSTIQHRVTGYKLVDPTQPGYTTTLALLLVDPNIRVISTANIPPQRLDWVLSEEEFSDQSLNKLSVEFQDRRGKLPLSLSEAKNIHHDILAELNEFSKYQHAAFESKTVSVGPV